MDGAAPLGWSALFEDRMLALDSAHVFLCTAQALAPRAKVVAEVGCGRGAPVRDEPGGAWQDLRGPGRTVIGIDIDPVGSDNPVVDEFRLIGADGSWPLDDGSVDLAVSDFVLEHVDDPHAFVAELTRVLRPGGVFVARTVSRFSPLSLVARVVPNRLHPRVVGVLQPGRQEHDVFPTEYKMNSRRALASLFDPSFEWAAASRTGLEQYLLRWPRLARFVNAVERHLPRSTHMALVLCARKR